jgi:hypothetical protein
MAGNYDLLVSGSLNSHQVKSGGSEVVDVTMVNVMVMVDMTMVVLCFHRS